MKPEHLMEMWHLQAGILEYLEAFVPSETELMLEIRRHAYAMDKEHWLVSPEVARLFQILARLTHARRVYELGSFLGYSGIAWAAVLPEMGEVVLTEIDPVNYELMTHYISRSPDCDRISCRFVDAHLDLASEDLFDIILIDHDKQRYPEAWSLAKRHLSNCGLIIIDDVLWRGRVCREEFVSDPSTKGVCSLNELVRDDPDMLSVIIPIGDGVCLAIQRPSRLI